MSDLDRFFSQFQLWTNVDLVADLLLIPLVGVVTYIILVSPWFDQVLNSWGISTQGQKLFKVLILFLVLYLTNRLLQWYQSREKLVILEKSQKKITDVLQ